MKLLERILGFKPESMNLRTEITAGTTTFLTMCYILAVNPAILATTGMDSGTLFTTTALVSAIATILMAVMAKIPFAQAPGMGVNAFFAFTMCQLMGLTWQQSLAVLLIEGVLFIIITFMNIREVILECIPANLRYSISAGIGMFIAFVGLKNAGIIVANPSTLVSVGSFTNEVVLGLIAIILSGVLTARRVKGALFYAILISTLIGIPMNVTAIPDGWMPFSLPHSIESTFCKFDFSSIFSLDMIIVIFSLLIINIFDTLGSLIGLGEKAGFINDEGNKAVMKRAMLSDSYATTISAILGCSTITTYVESASGIAEGGRSGVTALTTGLWFLLALLFSPLFLLVPSAATSGALVMVGVLMLDVIKKIDLSEISESFPAFITMITMVLCYSISDGICFGVLSYVIMKLCTGGYRQLNVTLIILSLLFVAKFALR